MTEEQQQMLNALRRAAADNERLADELMARRDYSAEIPAADAANIRRAIATLEADNQDNERLTRARECLTKIVAVADSTPFMPIGHVIEHVTPNAREIV